MTHGVGLRGVLLAAAKKPELRLSHPVRKVDKTGKSMGD
jgi:hypothetical protein